MHIADIKVPSSWVKLTDLMRSGRDEFKFEEEKSYYIHNNSSSILYVIESAEVPVGITESTLRVYAGKSAGYVKSKGDLYVCSNLPSVYPYPATISITVCDDVAADSPEVLGNFKLEARVKGAYVFKGTVADKSKLPAGAEVGDVYNLFDSGMNVAWTGSEWDELGTTYDLSIYALKEEVKAEIDSVHAQLDTKASKEEVTEALSTKAESADVVELASDLDTAKTDLEANQAELRNQIASKADKVALESFVTKTDFNSELILKADKAAVDAAVDEIKSELSIRANKDEVEAALATKADKATVEAALESKANKSEVEEALAGKQDAGNYADENEAKIIAACVNSIMSRLDVVEERVSSAAKTNVEAVEIASGSEVPAMTDTAKDYIVSGSVDATTKISGKSATLNSVVLSNNARLSVSANSGDVDFKSCSVLGDFPKANGNAAVSVGNAEYVTFKDLVIDATLYNAIEIGLSATNLPKGVLFDNCRFEGSFSNNAISIFGTQDNAVININNCYFESASNVLRLSNKTNAKNVTVNITNCTCDKWETNPAYAGFLLCQDYTSKPAAVAQENNLFGPDKLTVNISNLTIPGGSKLVAPENISQICGSNTADQVIYVYYDAVGSIAYDADKYPKVNIM